MCDSVHYSLRLGIYMQRLGNIYLLNQLVSTNTTNLMEVVELVETFNDYVNVRYQIFHLYAANTPLFT